MGPSLARQRSQSRLTWHDLCVPERSDLAKWWKKTGEAELGMILWAAWDPIGGVPRDEYDWYVPRLWTLLREHGSVLREVGEGEEVSEADLARWSERVHASEAKVAAQLSEWRTDRIGLPADPQSDRIVAEKLSDWLSPPGAGEFAPADLMG